MKIDFRIHSISHVVKHMLGHFLWVLKNNERPELLVLNYHGTQKKFIFNFEEQILFLLSCYEFVSPQEFGNLLNSKNLKEIQVEVNFGDMYVGNPTEEEIDEFLKNRGFIKDYWCCMENGAWGDITWSRK